MHAVHGAATGVGSDRGEQRGVRDAEPHFLALHISARVQRASPLVGAGQKRIASRLRPIRGRHTGEKQTRHGRPDRPTMTLRSCHSAERVRQAGRDGENQHHFKKVRQRRGVFKGMSAVGVKESTAVGAEFLDHFLRGHGTLCDHLLRHGLRRGLAVRPRDLRRVRLNQIDSRIGLQVLHDALGYQDEGTHHAYRQ